MFKNLNEKPVDRNTISKIWNGGLKPLSNCSEDQKDLYISYFPEYSFNQ